MTRRQECRGQGLRRIAGEIEVDGCHAYGALGSLAGIYTASMPVFVVRNKTFGNAGLGDRDTWFRGSQASVEPKLFEGHSEDEITWMGGESAIAETTGIDIFKVLETVIHPVIDMGIGGRDGGQIGAGIVTAPRDCFERAAAAYRERYAA